MVRSEKVTLLPVSAWRLLCFNQELHVSLSEKRIIAFYVRRFGRGYDKPWLLRIRLAFGVTCSPADLLHFVQIQFLLIVFRFHFQVLL